MSGGLLNLYRHESHLDDDWKGEAIIRNVPRDDGSQAKKINGKVARQNISNYRKCENCSTLISTYRIEKLCFSCIQDLRKKHEKPKTLPRGRPSSTVFGS